MFNSLYDFYRSREWQSFRNVVIAERMQDDGFVHDEITGKPIVKAYDIILHHIEELTEENVNDYNVSLNPKNIQLVSHKTHNIIHNKLGHKMREVYLVYGAPLAGKSEWVSENMADGDLVVDLDNIWQCVSGCPRYVHPNRLKAVVFKVRDILLDCVRYRNGKWSNAYVVGGYPLTSERERICKELGAREVFIDTEKETCLERVRDLDESLRKDYEGYVEDWFERWTPPYPIFKIV